MFGDIFRLQRLYVIGAITGKNIQYKLPNYLKAKFLIPSHVWDIKSDKEKLQTLQDFHQGQKPKEDLEYSQDGTFAMPPVDRMATKKGQRQRPAGHRTRKIKPTKVYNFFWRML